MTTRAQHQPEAPVRYIDAYLAPLLPMLARAEVTDVFVNRPGEVWVETIGGAIERHDMPELDDGRLWRLARQIASLSHQGISREYPLLAATLPDGARVQIVAPPATRGHMALAIRKHVVPDLTLSDYVAEGAFAPTRFSRGKSELHAVDAPEGNDPAELAAFLGALVRARRNIMISGGTSTGKTTFLNALIKEIPAEERLVLIEDTAEVGARPRQCRGAARGQGRAGRGAGHCRRPAAGSAAHAPRPHHSGRTARA